MMSSHILLRLRYSSGQNIGDDESLPPTLTPFIYCLSPLPLSLTYVPSRNLLQVTLAVAGTLRIAIPLGDNNEVILLVVGARTAAGHVAILLLSTRVRPPVLLVAVVPRLHADGLVIAAAEDGGN